MGHCLWSLDVHICSRFWKFAADGTFIFYGRIFHWLLLFLLFVCSLCLIGLFFLSRGSFLLVSRFLAPMGWRVRRTSFQPSAMIITFDLLIN